MKKRRHLSPPKDFPEVLTQVQAGALPPDHVAVDQAAREAQLGELVCIFPTNVRYLRFLRWACIGLLCLSVLCLFWEASHRNWAWYLHIIPWLSIVSIPAILVVWIGVEQWRNEGTHSISLYEQGLILSVLTQEEQFLEVVPWKRVMTIWHAQRNTWFLSYEDALGKEALLTIHEGFSEHALLIQRIQTQITQEQLGRALERFQGGGNCSFAQAVSWNFDENRAIVKEGVLVTQQGLKYKRQFLRWEDVASIAAKRKKIVITPRKASSSSRISLVISQIANAEMLVAFVSHILEQRKGS